VSKQLAHGCYPVWNSAEARMRTRTSRPENQRADHYATEPVDTEATVNLVVVFDAHTERVDEDRNENSSLKVFAVDKLLQLQSQSAQISYSHQRLLSENGVHIINTRKSLS